MDQYDDLDPEGSCFAQIQALVQSEFGETKQPTKSEKEVRKQGRTVNHDSCDSCGEGGDLLCCDQCPCAFHLTCCDPPLEEDDIPTGEWLCNECKSHPLENGLETKNEVLTYEHPKAKKDQNDKISSPFQTLVKMSSGKNPSTFSLPPELTCNTLFPGDRKRKLENEDKGSNAKVEKRESDFDDGCHLDKLCFACSRTARNSLHGDLIECDFCPLSFHTNCLQPPLTNKPTGMWMCPNHAEHAEPGLRDPRFSRRLKAYDKLRNNISQHTIKMDFLSRVHRLQNHPDFERKQETWKRKRLSLVPESIKWHYKNPPFQQLPEHIQESVKPLPPYRLPVTPPSASDQEEWLKSIVSLQCDIAKHLASLSVPKPQDGVKKTVKAVISGSSNHVISNSKLPNQTSTNCTNSSEKQTPKTTSCTTGNTTTSVKTITTSKASTVPAKVVSSPSTNGAHTSTVTSFSRVVTTHTVTSGGKTLTKPITILYASPSKNLTQQNGVSSNVTKHLNCVNKTTNSEAKPIAKVEGSVKKPLQNSITKTSTLQNSSSKTLTNIKSPAVQNSKNSLIQTPSPKTTSPPTSLVNSVKGTVKNDVKSLTNGPVSAVKPRVLNEPAAVKPRTVGESTKAVSVSPPGTSSARTMNVVGTVSTGLSSGNGSTKVIVLTNAGNGNIIKSIANTTLSSSMQRTVGSSGTLGNSSSTTTVTSPSVQRIVVQASPQKGIAGGGGTSNGPSVTPASQAASPVSTICAVSGLDSIQESELSKLDSRLVHVLAYQRLQQLITQTTGKVNPSNSSVARKISFNSNKETVVLPQNVPRGKAMAVLCPVHGEGISCPMVYKTLNIGQGPDMDVCLRNYGYCNYLSDKHCSIFYDEATKQYELLNYSEHGTYVDNVLYSCDFSDKPHHRTCVTSARRLDPSRLSKEKLLGDRKPSTKELASRRTAGLGIQHVTRPCNCSASSSTLIGGSGAGWEGTATLHHGSYIKMGCLQFVFSIVNQDGKIDATKHTKAI
ncbi:PHD finger protein 12-like [Dendronephthya gigantea]|uniref:PHD finger protein 12-like n=1 Tax=Dendronephthya gigantea TaxID=151771 RepID=UPI00106D3095|nr:PHD finger protein 12-like [Dendronephthya gigantea]